MFIAFMLLVGNALHRLARLLVVEESPVERFAALVSTALYSFAAYQVYLHR